MSIDLTSEELDRLRTIVASHVDLLLQPKIDAAMKKMNETEVARLINVKMGDQQILHKLWEAKA